MALIRSSSIPGVTGGCLEITGGRWPFLVWFGVGCFVLYVILRYSYGNHCKRGVSLNPCSSFMSLAIVSLNLVMQNHPCTVRSALKLESNPYTSYSATNTFNRQEKEIKGFPETGNQSNPFVVWFFPGLYLALFTPHIIPTKP